MKKGILFSVAVMMMMISTQAQATCPDLSGKWLGICKLSKTSLPPAVDKYQAFTGRSANELEIIQVGQANPVNCSLMMVDGSVVTVGGLTTQALSVPVAGESISISTSGSGAWNNEALVTKATGIIQVGAESVAYGKGERFELKADGSLDRHTVFHGENFKIETDCNYKRN